MGVRVSDDEEWRPAPGFSGLYSVSSTGRVRSDRSGKILSPDTTRDGHLQVCLYRSGVRNVRKVHRLVCEAFNGPSPSGEELVLHWDDNPGNNHRSNLRWGTVSDNWKDMVRNGKHINARKTHCPQGHEYNEGNTYWWRGTSRRCRACGREWWREKNRANIDA